MSDTLEQTDALKLVQEVRDRMAIEELFVRYYSGLGSGDPDAFGGFFAENPELDVNGIVCRSTEEIRTMYAEVDADKPNLIGQFRMMLTNLIIEVDGDTARAQMLWTQTLNETIKSVPRFIEQGREYDLLVKQGGRWKIKKRVVIADSNLPDMMDKTYTPRADYQMSSL
ncbi:nuclear transport factor 2 family protein [Sphingobium nicotianae]|uniref:Nuclear transport factor 2 family protein n=1 Tax=Sphingobium nicotianae TaxID=2782607 RepID=A0A9X1DFI5_9SPHN|nr:nuclear transport factor 2 family protein [Sphingobium nicotianae]MBT2189347.1 nuclear transport factor 2 family protein [Sphingobium nicotianae]